ncbi:MAG: ATP-binding protein [Bacillota bacterium]
MSSECCALTPNAAKKLMTFLYNTDGRQSVLLLGPPGIGKSALVRETAMEIAHSKGRVFLEYNNRHFDAINLNEVYQHPERYFAFIDLRLTETEPVDLMGRPAPVKVGNLTQLVYQPPQWAVLLSSVSGCLFLDEITNVYRPDVVAASYKLVHDRMSGFTRFCPGVQVVAAGNRPEDSSIANLLPAPMLNRVYRIEVKPPRLTEWAAWMNANQPHYEEKVFAYLCRFPEDFYRVPGEVAILDGYPTPRSYEFLARDLAAAVRAGLGAEVIRTLCIAALGTEVGEKFFAFYKHPVPSFDELMESPSIFERLSIDERYFAVVVIGQGISKKVLEIKTESRSGSLFEARKMVNYVISITIPLLETVAGISREYLGLLWFTLANRVDSPWKEAVYLEICERSDALRKAYSAIGNLLRAPA